MGARVVSILDPSDGITRYKIGANTTLGPEDLVGEASLPVFGTRGATLELIISGSAFTGVVVSGSIGGVLYQDVIDIITGTKASTTTASQLIVLGANYRYLKVQANGGNTDSYIAATLFV